VSPDVVTRLARRARERAERSRNAALRYDAAWEVPGHPQPRFPGVVSQLCTAAQIESPEYAAWCERFGERVLVHRKLWEWCYIAQALHEAGVLRPGARGLGFGVGREPLTAVIAGAGCDVVATDLAADAREVASWAASGQHAARLDDLNRDGLCPPDAFAARVSFRPVDMNAVPDDLTGFDFTWSSCALEHLGDLDAGLAFFRRQLRCLRPGGVGVHTTEYNVSSNNRTIARGPTVLYRRRDVEALVAEMVAGGHRMEATLAIGDRPADRHVDVEPWSTTHLKVAYRGHVTTSLGLLVQRT
jgi:SAM-dependent methyltransferase